MGHTRIGFLTAAHGWSAIEERIDGYRDAHSNEGLGVDDRLIVRAGEFTALDASIAVSDLLERDSRPTAVMCGNDLLALGVAKAARDRGLEIPRDLAITGFDDFDFARAVDPPLTTTRIPGYEMGRHAAAVLIDAVERHGKITGRRFPTEVFLRGSA
jgi:DNA-binding LacI/PurR family transcriptional regulator